MKYTILGLLLFGLIFTGCVDKTSEADKEASVTIETKEEKKVSITENSERIKDCDDFLDTYETWTDDILTVMAKHKDDPVGLATSPDYINTMTKGVNFLQDWGTISTSCAVNPTYEIRMKAIQEKMEVKQKELGFK